MTLRFSTRVAFCALFPAMLAGCSRDVNMPAVPNAAAVAFPNTLATLEWQAEARNLIATNRLSPLAAGRVLAALGVAQHRAVRTVDADIAANPPGQGFGAGGRSTFEARRGAVAGASAKVLAFFFAAAGPALEQKLNEQGSAGPGGMHPQFAHGVVIGNSAADVLIERVRNDRFTVPWTPPAPTGPDKWTPESLPPAGATLGNVVPYHMTSGSQFRPSAPPAFMSPAFNADLNAVVAATVNRTPQQLAIARLWDYAAGTFTPVGYWNNAAAGYVEANGLDELSATEVFGLMHSAIFDALIGCWDAKYHYWTLRPYQASTAVALALGRPNHPSFPSGHSCVSAAAGRVLTHFFPDNATELTNLVIEAGLSRVYAGIHYFFDVSAGQQIGRSAAELAITKGL